MCLRLQVADTQRPILAVGTLTVAGNEVGFHRRGGSIVHPRAKRRIEFGRRGGVCVLEVLVEPSVGVPASAGDPPAGVPASAGGARPDGSKPGFTRQGAL